MIDRLNSDEKFIPRYWRHEAVAFATDAYVFNSLVEKFFPEVNAHFSKHSILPETYCQKWFVGLCINVLPYVHLYRFFELFLSYGFRFLFQFGLALVEHTKEHILASSEPSIIFALLRMDPKIIEQKKINPRIILDRALIFDISDVNFPELREILFNRNLKARLEAAAKQEAQAEDDDDEDSEDGEDCEMCHEMMPEIYCKECKLLLCENCSQKKKETHDPNHSTCSLDEREDNCVDELTNQVKKICLETNDDDEEDE